MAKRSHNVGSSKVGALNPILCDSLARDLIGKWLLFENFFIFHGRCCAAVIQVNSGLLRRPIRKLYKLKLCAETDSLPPFKRSLENSSGGDASTVCKVELIDKEVAVAECEVEPSRMTRSGRKVVCPCRLQRVITCNSNMLLQVARWRMPKALLIGHLRFTNCFIYLVSLPSFCLFKY